MFNFKITCNYQIAGVRDMEKAEMTLTIEALDATEAGIQALDLIRSKGQIMNVVLQISLDHENSKPPIQKDRGLAI